MQRVWRLIARWLARDDAAICCINDAWTSEGIWLRGTWCNRFPCGEVPAADVDMNPRCIGDAGV